MAINIDKELKSIAKSIDPKDKVDSLPVYVSQEHTRAKIALYFTYVFLFLVATSMLAPLLINIIWPHTFNDPIESGKNLVTVLSSILAGPFGFIVGFYFKQENNKE